MSRKIRCIAITLAVSALITASAQAAPSRLRASEAATGTGAFAQVWERLLSWASGALHGPQHWLSPAWGNDTSHLDPNGNH